MRCMYATLDEAIISGGPYCVYDSKCASINLTFRIIIEPRLSQRYPALRRRGTYPCSASAPPVLCGRL